MRDDDWVLVSATELGKKLRAGSASSVEITRFFLNRLERRAPGYNALAALTPEIAMAQARRADRLLRSREEGWPLLGVPYAAKDLLATKGVPTRWGSPPHRDQAFDYDASVIRRLARAGAVLTGKLAMVELAGGGGYEYATASLHGPGLNPWDTNHWAGGSSSGSGIAVSAALVPYALGSETWGSIVTPSAYCGITGLRPTWSLVSRHGAMELAWSMDKIGPMARSAEDCGWVLQAIAGPDRNDPTAASRGFEFNPRPSGRRFRLGILPADFGDAPDLERAFEEAVRVLRRGGMRVSQAKLPDLPYEATARTILNGEIAAAHADLIRSDRLEQLVDRGQKQGLRDSLNLTASEYAKAVQERLKINRALLRVFERFDALLSPSLMNEALPLEANIKKARRRQGNYSVLGALCGLPALSLPMGFGGSGLPLGMAVTGNLFDEAAILEIGMAFQRETDWHRSLPPGCT